MSANPIVTIVCCTYNHEKYIRDTLLGFLNQKVDFNYTIIVHDDASSDSTQSIIKDIANQYPDKFVLILQSENQFQRGVKIEKDIIAPLIKTKYVALCEGDDLWIDDTKLSRSISFLESNSGYSSFGHNTLVLNCKNGKKYRYCNYKKDCDFSLKETINNVPHFSSLVLKAKYFIERPDYFNRLNAGDVSLKISLCTTEKMRYSRRVMSLYRKYSGNNSFSTNNIQTTDQKIQNARKAISYLNYVKEFVSQKDVRYVDLRILKKEFEILYLSEDYRALFDKKFKYVIKTLSVKERLKIRIKRIKKWLKR